MIRRASVGETVADNIANGDIWKRGDAVEYRSKKTGKIIGAILITDPFRDEVVIRNEFRVQRNAKLSELYSPNTIPEDDQ